MLRADVGGALEVGDGPRHADDAEIGAHGESHLGHQALQRAPAVLVQRAELLDLPGAHLGVGGGTVRREALRLREARLEHPRRHGLAALGLPGVQDFLGRDRMHPDMQVYTIKNN